jgi:hypothetical protein
MLNKYDHAVGDDETTNKGAEYGVQLHMTALLHVCQAGARVRALAFIFATSVWTLISLLPYRIFHVLHIHWIGNAALQFPVCSAAFTAFYTVSWTALALLSVNPVRQQSAVVFMIHYPNTHTNR